MTDFFYTVGTISVGKPWNSTSKTAVSHPPDLNMKAADKVPKIIRYGPGLMWRNIFQAGLSNLHTCVIGTESLPIAILFLTDFCVEYYLPAVITGKIDSLNHS